MLMHNIINMLYIEIDCSKYDNYMLSKYNN